MSNDEGMTKSECRKAPVRANSSFEHSNFTSSFVSRASSFRSRGLFVSWRMFGGAFRFCLCGPSLFEALLQNLHEIDHFGRRFFRLRFFFDLLSSGVHFLFDHFHERVTIIIPI